jgi:S-formylglutathione hydrolase FrmB
VTRNIIRSAVLALLVALLATGPAGARPDGTGLPAGWTLVRTGPSGGTVWRGRIPNAFAPWDRRASAIYLPPGYSSAQRYPVVYLLHGMPGSPTGFWDSMRLATRVDGLIAGGTVRPFVVVMPVAGPVRHPASGEWAGIWESYVVRNVVPWVDAHLPTVATPAGRAIEGLCAGGFGAMDIGLRHPGMFSTLGSWEGYFTPVFRDGPFVHATAAYLLAHDPQQIVGQQTARLRANGTRFFITYDGNHGKVLAGWSVAFSRQLDALGLPHQTLRIPHSERKHLWGASLLPGLVYASAGFTKHGL